MGTWDDTGWAGYLLDQCFAGVRVAGAAPLPPVRAQTVQDRVDAFSGLPHALGSSASGTAAATAASPRPAAPRVPTTPTTAAAPSAAATHRDAASRRRHEGGTPRPPSADSGWSLGSILRTAGLVLLGLLVVLVLLRRRAVKRQRARRIARIEAHAEARRRGMIDVLDGDDDSDIRVLPARTGHHVAAAGPPPHERPARSCGPPVRATAPAGHDRDRRRPADDGTTTPADASPRSSTTSTATSPPSR